MAMTMTVAASDSWVYLAQKKSESEKKEGMEIFHKYQMGLSALELQLDWTTNMSQQKSICQ